MHGAVGTALGGVTTLVGEPQNLLIAEKAGWDFIEFFPQDGTCNDATFGMWSGDLHPSREDKDPRLRGTLPDEVRSYSASSPATMMPRAALSTTMPH